MKKTILTIIAALMGVALYATDFQYLYWMVDESADVDKYDFTYATVKTTDSSYFYLYNQSGNTGNDKFYISNIATADSGLTTSAGYAGLGTADYTGSTFLFELWTQDDVRVGWKSVAFASLADYVFANTSQTGATPYVVKDVVPEPTSGVLLLLGFAGLALRRRKQLNIEG